MLTAPSYWNTLWGHDGTRCDYQILLNVEDPIAVGDHIVTPSGRVYRVDELRGTQAVAILMGSSYVYSGEIVYHTPEDYFASRAYFTISSLVGQISYTGDEDIEEDSLILDKSVFTAAKPIGNTPCFTMECCLRQKEADIPKGAWLELQIRLQNSTQYTRWVSLGKFKVNKRVSYPDGWVKLSCRDRMQMANQPFIKDESVDVTTWPKPMSEVMNMTLDIMGITLDPSTAINEGEGWVVSLPLGLSIRTIWSSIAAAHGGNFIITPQDTLKLIRPRAAEEATLEAELSEGGFELLGDPVTVDRLTLSTNELHLMAGNSGDNNIDVDCLYASAEAALYAKSQLEGSLYTPVKCSSMVFDPLAEVYDTFLVNGVLTTWSQLTVKCGIVPLVDGIAETSAEPASEYGFEDTPLNEIKSQIKAVSESIDAADKDALEKVTQEELFNKLTNNGTAQGLFFLNGQIYINAAYLAAGTLKADLIKSGILQSVDGSFYLNLDTGELTVTGMATKSDLQNLKQEGVEKIVTPVMKYTMSDDGLRIQKPGEEIGNKMDHTGMEVSKGSETMLRADKDGVIATDVTVRNFLNMGDNSRFEDYNNGTDSARTGCFAM